MFAVNSYKGIEDQEKNLEDKHIIILLLIKKSDVGAKTFIDQFNYFHQRSKEYCTIYPVGYSSYGFNGLYKDVEFLKGIENENWEYSDTCFEGFLTELERRLSHWQYSGEPEVIVLQNNPEAKGSILNFQGYISIDVNYGIRKNYIESFPRLMESLIMASKREVTAKGALRLKYRYSPAKILEEAVESCKKIPTPIKQIIGDRFFLRASGAKR
jgi:hypothetical protein